MPVQFENQIDPDPNGKENVTLNNEEEVDELFASSKKTENYANEEQDEVGVHNVNSSANRGLL